jgi:hypothetical protein
MASNKRSKRPNFIFLDSTNANNYYVYDISKAGFGSIKNISTEGSFVIHDYVKTIGVMGNFMGNSNHTYIQLNQ